MPDNASKDNKNNKVHAEKGDKNNDNDFTFACAHPESPIAADKIFHNGQIRPVYHTPKDAVVGGIGENTKKPGGGATGGEPAGPYCVWSPDRGRKSGAAPMRRWTFKDLVMKSRKEKTTRRSSSSSSSSSSLPCNQVGYITNVNGSNTTTKVTKPI